MAKITLRIWILIVFLIISALAIRPTFSTGVLLTSVDKNSDAFEQGLRQGDIIQTINEKEIKNIEDYSRVIEESFTKPGEKVKLIIETKTQSAIIFSNVSPEITVKNVPSTNIKTGLDLQGGARALVKPETSLSQQEFDDLIAASTNRFDVYGLSDVKIRSVSDLSGEKFMLIEIAGATPSDLEELISKQGKFEAKIGNETVFIGGNKDITYVSRTGAEAGIETCFKTNNAQEACNYRFVIYLSENAAQRHADITSKLGTNSSGTSSYLDKPLDLYLDDLLVDSLLISEGLKGRPTTQISIQGSGTGLTREDALKDAEASMQQLQTVLITGSLPFKLEIVKLDTISPLLGAKFINSILLAGVFALLSVGLIIFIKYRKIKSSLALLFTSFSELFIILGVASLINWNLDLPSIAGILATIGTGVDQQIVILDESRNQSLSMNERLKRALFIIIAAYFTSVVSLLPLWWAGAGLLKGFAITTIIGITAGVLITRPAFADMIKKIEN